MLIPLTIAFLSDVIAIFVYRLPAIIGLCIFCFIIFPLLCLQRKTNNDWAKMFIIGLVLTIVCLLVLVVVFYIAHQVDSLEHILL